MESILDILFCQAYNPHAVTSSRIQRLTALFHHRWSVAVLAELHRGGGGKFVTLVNRLSISRDSLRRTLDSLIAQGWVVRNPGHGHPMRPEYILTASGQRLAPWCARFCCLLKVSGIEDVGLRKWSMPIALALRKGRRRFSELKSFLPGLTARALTLALKELHAAGLVERHVSDGYPPATYYQLTRNMRSMKSVLDEF